MFLILNVRWNNHWWKVLKLTVLNQLVLKCHFMSQYKLIQSSFDGHDGWFSKLRRCEISTAINKMSWGGVCTTARERRKSPLHELLQLHIVPFCHTMRTSRIFVCFFYGNYFFNGIIEFAELCNTWNIWVFETSLCIFSSTSLPVVADNAQSELCSAVCS